MPPKRRYKDKNTPPPSGRRRTALVILLVAAAGLGALFFSLRRSPEGGTKGSSDSPKLFRLADQKVVFAEYGGSKSCRKCHEEAYGLWEKSHHGLAERGFQPAEDRRAFDPLRSFGEGIQHTEVRWNNNAPEVRVAGLSGVPENFHPQRVIGESPLRQFLVPFPGGRLQTLEACYDPRTNDWFNLYAGEQRQPGEWGAWTGRGMNWNDMCATCHNTRLRKNYGEQTDSYATAMAEISVGCEACHGPLQAHNDWQRQHGKSGSKDPTIRKLSREQVVENCAFCHSRRTDVTGDFKPGDSYYDHMQPAIVDHSDIYYPDGQVRDEDYEFSAFLGSRMRMGGVWCMDCHEPHSAKRRLPGNWLCMRCHDGSNTNAPVIAPVAHSHHRVRGYDLEGVLTNADLSTYKSEPIAESGGECVNCHMPQTVYMQRHWRHDHGFTIPDPLLTKEFQIPNACNRCHKDKDTEWAIEWADKWYGKKLERPSRDRTRWIARARQEDPAAREPLIGLFRSETNGYWRAAAANLLSQWADERDAMQILLNGLGDTDPLVRLSCVAALGPAAEAGHPAATESLRKALEDPARGVRVAAAFPLRTSLDTNSPAGSELMHSLSIHSDQPVGQLQKGIFAASRNEPGALDHFRKAVLWDPYSPPLRLQLATALSASGNSAEALKQLQESAKLFPKDAEVYFQLGLALNENGQLAEAEQALRRATELNPRHARAWYNLGLAQNALKQPPLALESLARAEAADPKDPRIPYARATVLLSLGRQEEARKALGRVLSLDPNHNEAFRLLERMKTDDR